VRVLVVVLTLAGAPALLGSCGGVSCSQRAPVPGTTFVGRVSAVHAGAADFVVESVQPPPGGPPDAHTPAVGSTVTVTYADGGERFLRAGTAYRVEVDWQDGRLESDVHTAEDCGTASGTTRTDGSHIDTARVSWFRVHRALLVIALAPIVALAVLGSWLWLRRRRPRTVHVDDRYL
jgi:hypothetical protein